MVPNGRHLASAFLEFYFQFERAKTRPKLKKKITVPLRDNIGMTPFSFQVLNSHMSGKKSIRH